MTWRGRVRGGVIIPDQDAKLDEGSEVTIQPVEAESSPGPVEECTLAEHLLKFAGVLDGLPADLAQNHDHYIHGTPKK